MYCIAPPSIMSLALNVNALENGNVTLMCVAISEPLYTVQWLNPNGSVISEDNIKLVLKFNLCY